MNQMLTINIKKTLKYTNYSRRYEVYCDVLCNFHVKASNPPPRQSRPPNGMLNCSIKELRIIRAGIYGLRKKG